MVQFAIHITIVCNDLMLPVYNKCISFKKKNVLFHTKRSWSKWHHEETNKTAIASVYKQQQEKNPKPLIIQKIKRILHQSPKLTNDDYEFNNKNSPIKHIPMHP